MIICIFYAVVNCVFAAIIKEGKKDKVLLFNPTWRKTTKYADVIIVGFEKGRNVMNRKYATQY